MPRPATSVIISPTPQRVSDSFNEKTFESDPKSLEEFSGPKQNTDNSATTVSVGSFIASPSKTNYLEEVNPSSVSVSFPSSSENGKNVVNSNPSKKLRPSPSSDNESSSFPQIVDPMTTDGKMSSQSQQQQQNIYLPQDANQTNVQPHKPNDTNQSMHVTFQPMHHPAVAAAVAASAFFQSQKNNPTSAQLSSQSGTHSDFPPPSAFPAPQYFPPQNSDRSSHSSSNLPFFPNSVAFPANVGTSPFHMMAYHKQLQNLQHQNLQHQNLQHQNQMIGMHPSQQSSVLTAQHPQMQALMNNMQNHDARTPDLNPRPQSEEPVSIQSSAEAQMNPYSPQTIYQSLTEPNNNSNLPPTNRNANIYSPKVDSSSPSSTANDSSPKTPQPYYSLNNNNFNQSHTAPSSFHPSTVFNKNIPVMQKQPLESIPETNTNYNISLDTNKTENKKDTAANDAETKKQRAREKNRLHSRNSRLRKKDSILRMKEDNSFLQKFKIITEAMADMVSVHDLTDEARIIYANPSFVAKYIIPDVVPFPGFKMFPRQPNVRIPSCFLQLVHEDDVKTLVDCIRFVRSDATQAPILRLRMLTSSAPPCQDCSRLFSFFQSRIQVSSSVGSLIIVTRPAGSDNEFFRYTPKNEYAGGGEVSIGPTGFICKNG